MEGFSEESESLSTQLLEAIWHVFEEKKVVRLHTKVLLPALLSVEEAPWKNANNGREIDAYWLRERLRGFLPRPANPKEAAEHRRSREWREGKGTLSKGYTEDHLREAWWRYLERKTPTETAKAAGHANGARASAADQPPETEDVQGLAGDGAGANGATPASAGNGAHNRPGPAKRRTSPSEAAKPVGEA